MFRQNIFVKIKKGIRNKIKYVDNVKPDFIIEINSNIGEDDNQ